MRAGTLLYLQLFSQHLEKFLVYSERSKNNHQGETELNDDLNPVSYQPPSVKFVLFFNWSIVGLGLPSDSVVKNLPAIQELPFQPPSREVPLEEGMQPTPVSLPGESHGQRSLTGYSPGGHKESDMTEWLLLKSGAILKPLLPKAGLSFSQYCF